MIHDRSFSGTLNNSRDGTSDDLYQEFERIDRLVSDCPAAEEPIQSVGSNLGVSGFGPEPDKSDGNCQ